jgi:hypothetical protein
MFALFNTNEWLKTRMMRWVVYVACMVAITSAYNNVVKKSEEKRPLWRLKRRWEDNIKMDIREIGWEGVNWIHLAQDSKSGGLLWTR